MTEAAQDSLRIVLFIREPLGTMYQTIQEIFRELGHRLVAVVTSAGPRTRRTDRYREIVAQTPPSTDVIVSNFPSRWAGILAPFNPDLILVVGWSWKLPEDVIALPRLGVVNWHGAMLPKYRGRGDWALQWILRNDDQGYGVTFHWVDGDWDTGPILAQAPIEIDDDDDINALIPKLVEVTVGLLPTVIDKAARRDPGTPQPDGGFYCGPVEPGWRNLDWNTSARTIHNQVRSWFGQGAFATLAGANVAIIRTRLVQSFSDGAPPGTVVARREGSILVQCADGPIEVLEYVPRQPLAV